MCCQITVDSLLHFATPAHRFNTTANEAARSPSLAENAHIIHEVVSPSSSVEVVQTDASSLSLLASYGHAFLLQLNTTADDTTSHLPLPIIVQVFQLGAHRVAVAIRVFWIHLSR